jgi:hypothetical protein
VAVDKKLMAALRARDGDVCAWSGVETDTLVPHHRANRGAGGFKGADRLSNLVLVDSIANGRFEADLQEKAKLLGFKISRYANPESIPLFHKMWGWVLLKDDGSVVRCERD